MADKEDLSEQLNLTKKLADQVERMAAAAEKVDASYQSQLELMTKLSGVFGQINTDTAVQGLGVMKKAFVDVQNKIKDSEKTSEDAFKKLGKWVTETSDLIKKKFPTSVAIAVGALKGFQQGIKNIVALTKGVTGFVTGFVDGLANITVSIIAIPFKMFEGLIDLAAKSAGGSNELMKALEDLRKEFGAFHGPTNKAIIDVTKSMKGFGDTGLNTWRVFGNMAERLNYIREIATEMGGSFSKLRKEIEDNGGAVLAYQKGLGILNEDMKGVTMRAVKDGKSFSSVAKDMTKQSYALGDAFELDAKLISRDMSKAFTDVKHFGGATVKQIAEASTYARKLGFELKDITGTLDQFDTFDSAAENAAKLSQAFGVNIDAFELMKAQSPAEQLEMLRKSFKSAGVDASNFNRAQLKLAATTTGLNEDIVQSALSMKNQGVRLDEIKKKSGDAEKKTLTQAEAMHQLADAIERMTPSGGGMHGGFWDQFFAGIGAGLQSTKEFYGLMRNIQIALRQTYMIGVQLGRELMKIVPGLSDIFGGMRDFFEPSKFRKMFQGVSNSIKGFFDPKSADEGSLPRLIDKLRGVIENMFTIEGSAGKKMLDGFKKFFMKMSDIAAQAIKYLSAKITDGIKFVADIISGKKKLDFSSAISAGQGGLGFLGEMLQPIIASLKDAWTMIAPALGDLLSALGNWALEWASEHKALLSKIGLAIFGYVFASSLIGGIAGLITKVLIESIATSAAGAAVKKAGTSLIQGMLGGAAPGAMSGPIGTFGKNLGAAVGIAAAAYLAYGEGKKIIDETFAKGQKANEVLRSTSLQAEITANSKRATNGDKLEQLNKAREALKAQEASLADKSTGDKILNWIGGTDIAADQAADSLAKTKKVIAQLEQQLKGVDQTALSGMTEVRRKAEKEAAASREFLGPATVQDAQQQLASLEDLAKKVTGKNFDIAKTIQTIKDKFKDIKFDIFKEDQAGDIAVSTAVIQRVQEFFSAANATFETLNKLSAAKSVDVKTLGATIQGVNNVLQSSMEDIKKLATTTSDMAAILKPITPGMVEGITNAISSIAMIPKVIQGNVGDKSGLAGALNAVSEMVKQANELDKALSDGNVNKINIKAKLEQVARAVGLGGKATYTVNPSKEVQITVNMTVTMNAGEVEKVILQRENSILRDRINYSTVNSTKPEPTLIPNNPNEPAPPMLNPSPPGTKT